MNSVSTSSGSTWQQELRIFREGVEVFLRWLTSLFSIITLKITDSGKALFVSVKALFASIRGIEVTRLKETLEICYNSFTWFFGIIFTLKITDTGKAFFTANYPVMIAIILIKFLSLLTVVSGTISQIYTQNLWPLIVMLLLESVASLLALSLISVSIVWIILGLLFCIFMVFGYCNRSEIYEMIPERIRRWIGNHNPEGPSLPTVTEPADARE